MVPRQSLRRTGTKGQGRGCFGRRSSTPDQSPAGEARVLDIPHDSPLETLKESPTAPCKDAVQTRGLLKPDLERGRSWTHGNFLVRLQVDKIRDSGARRRWLEMLIYGDPLSPAATEDPGPNCLNLDEGHGVGVREPLPKPLDPLTGMVSMSVKSGDLAIL